ncbi:MAG: hypothetical protein IPL43_12175 [Micropruina sp.]|nr:hypothetical protein [Micropruina sp.]
MALHDSGDWFGVITPLGSALLPGEVPLAAVETVWDDLRSGRGLGAVIDTLVAAFGNRLSALPAFGVLTLDGAGAVAVALRGAVTAQVWSHGAAETTLITGAGVSTWNERAPRPGRSGAVGRPRRGRRATTPGGGRDRPGLDDHGHCAGGRPPSGTRGCGRGRAGGCGRSGSCGRAGGCSRACCPRGEAPGPDRRGGAH